MVVHVISHYFGGHRGAGGIHEKRSVEFLESSLLSRFPEVEFIWHIAWAKFEIPGALTPDTLDLEKGLVEKRVYPVPHVMTPRRVYEFLLSKVPPKATVLYLDLKMCKCLEKLDTFPPAGYSARIFLDGFLEDYDSSAPAPAPPPANDTLLVFENDIEKLIVEGDLFVSFHDRGERKGLEKAYRFPPTHEELAMLEFWERNLQKKGKTLQDKDKWLTNAIAVFVHKMGVEKVQYNRSKDGV